MSVGMANYHFRTNGNLIEKAVQEYVSGVIRTLGFVAEDPGIFPGCPSSKT